MLVRIVRFFGRLYRKQGGWKDATARSRDSETMLAMLKRHFPRHMQVSHCWREGGVWQCVSTKGITPVSELLAFHFHQTNVSTRPWI